MNKLSFSFTVWLEPEFSLQETAKRISVLLGIDSSAQLTDRYDEYPGYDILDLEEENVFIRLLGSPHNIDQLVIDRPDEFDEKDRNHCLTIHSEDGIPVQTESGFSLPYQTEEVAAIDLIKKIKMSGLRVYKNSLPYTYSYQNRSLKEYPVD